MAIGFDAVESDARKVGESLRAERIAVHKAEDVLRQELRRLEDLEHGIKTIERRMEDIRLLSERYDKTIQEMVAESARRSNMPDKIMTLIMMAENIYGQLAPLMQRTSEDARRLMVTEASLVALQGKEELRAVMDIDDKARAIGAEVSVISTRIDAYGPGVKNLRRTYQHYPSPTNRMGF